MSKMLMLLTGLVSLIFGLNIELQVKECAGVGSQGFPITSIVPLPRGQFQDISHFRLTDAGGTTVPAQFNILNRRWIDDNSIANLSIEYQPTVTAFTTSGTGISKYYLRDDGTGNATGTGLQVTDAADKITVVTGPLKFTVKKTAFNILDQVWFDKNSDGSFSTDESMITSDNRTGAVFTGRLAGDIQYDADRSDLTVEVEEAGPMRAVIRAEAVTKYYGTTNHTHGWAVRIYAFAGKPFIKIDYQLQNSAKTKRVAWPLYFHAMDLNFKLNLGANPTVKVGKGDGALYQRALGKGMTLAQERDSTYRVYGASFADTLASGKYPDGFIDIDDGSVGVTAMTRYYWQMWPNGLSVDSTNQLSFQLWPSWSCQLRGKVPVRPMSSNHWYWLFDMTHSYKEVFLGFHTSGATNQQLINQAKTFVFHPVATYSTAWCGEAKASLDMRGMIPFTNKTSTSDLRIPTITDKTNVGWAYFSLNGRRDETAQAGGWPQGLGNFFASENPADYYLAEWAVMGDLNARQHSMAQYSYERDFEFLRLGTNTVDEKNVLPPPFVVPSWRQFILGGSTSDTAFLPETWDDVDPLDNAHAWVYHLIDAYLTTGNLWEKDWYKFVGEFRKVAAYNDELLEVATRANAHPYEHALHAFKAVGDTDITFRLQKVIRGDLFNSYNKFGERNSACCGAPPGESSFQAGFMARFLVNMFEESGDPQVKAECFQVLAGIMHWNLTYGNFNGCHAPQVASSIVSGNMISDPQAWYYWNTGKKEYLTHLLTYIDKGILGGNQPAGIIGTIGKTSTWTGEFEGRWVQKVRITTRTDTIPPSTVTDLRIVRSGKNCTLTWTGPKDAVRYHIVWGDRPIVEQPSESDNYLNWWRAKVIGPRLQPTEGASETVSFTVPDTGYKLAFAALFTFDSIGNMSRMSNLVTTDGTPPSPVTGLQGSVLSATTVKLTWQAASDAESKIWWYNIYRDGIRIATVDSSNLSFTDDNLIEETAYGYTVAAVNGSLVEGAKGSVNVQTPLDTEAPTVLSVKSVDSLGRVTVVFSEKVLETSAEDAAHYSLDKGKKVKSAVLQGDGRTVILTCDSLVFADTYQLTISQVKDASKSQNVIVTVSVPFTYKKPLTVNIVTKGSTGNTIYGMDTVAVGKYIYMDDAFAIKTVQLKYVGLPMIKLRNESDVGSKGDSIIAFDVNKEIRVFVAYDDSQAAHGYKPSWLSSFTDNGDNISVLSTSGKTWTFSLNEKVFPAGRVKLGGNNGVTSYSTYFIILMPTDSSWVDNEDGIPEHEMECGIYADPNPFNPQVSVSAVFDSKFSVQNSPGVALQIYDVAGRCVATQMPRLTAMRNRVRFQYSWNASGFGSGLYIARVAFSGKILQKKIMLIK